MSVPIKFKSVGKKIDEIQGEKNLNKIAKLLPIGIKTPLRLGNNDDGIFSMHLSAASQIQDNFRNLLLTNHGDRLGLYDFGANLQPLTTEITAREDFEAEAMTRIKAATSKYMPFLDLQAFETSIDNFQNKDTGLIKIKINYGVPILGIKDKKIEVILYVI